MTAISQIAIYSVMEETFLKDILENSIQYNPREQTQLTNSFIIAYHTSQEEN